MRIHSVFHITLLKPCHSNISLQKKSTSVQSDEEYEIKLVLIKRTVSSELMYLVKWVGYDIEKNTWEPHKNLKHCVRTLWEFERERQQIVKNC